MLDLVRACFDDASTLLRRLDANGYQAAVSAAALRVAATIQQGGKLLIFGNGGSASDAQHIAGELVGRFLSNRRALPAIALASDAAVLTCIANDFSYSDVFARQIEALASAKDIVWGISTSGNSGNVVEALKTARNLGVTTLLMTGNGGGRAREFADIVLDVPSPVTARIQEIHVMTYHAICSVIDDQLFAPVKDSEECLISAL